jgi:phytoene/squalene synthetase
MWAKNMKLADQRWRENWERKLAERRKAMAKVERIADRIKRQRSWEAWQASKMLAAGSGNAPRQLG